MANRDAMLAELVTTRARGEINQEELEAARKIVEKGDRPADTVETKPNRKPDGQVSFGQGMKFGGAIFAFCIVVAIISSSFDTGGDGKRAASRDGSECFSVWDGSSREFVKSVKSQLRDPSSFEHVETRFTEKNARGEIGVRMTYRAKNGFGGINTETAYGTISANDCRLVSNKN